MKVLFISNDPSIFDPASASRARMREYAAAFGELHIVSAAPPRSKSSQEGALFLHPTVTPRLLRVFVLALRARSVIRTHAIEIISAQDPFEQGLAALYATRGTAARLHVQVHTDFLSPWFRRASLLDRLRCHIADHVLPGCHGVRAVSERVRSSLLARYTDRISVPSVIPIAVDAASPPRAPLPQHAFKFALIAVGRLEGEKRVIDILEALKLVRVRYPTAGLFIVGDGREHRRLVRAARARGLSDHVIFLGARSDARALLGSAQAFIQASAYEGYGRTLIEAALAKVPIITTDVGIVGDILKAEEDVLAVPVAAPAALATAIIRLIEDNALRSRLALNAETAARAHLAAQGSLPERLRDDLARLL